AHALLGRGEEVPQGAACLSELGYKVSSRVIPDYHIRYVRRRATPIEIHWGLTPPHLSTTVDLEGIFRRAAPLSIEGESALAMSPEDLLLHLCVHAAGSHRLDGVLQGLWD